MRKLSALTKLILTGVHDVSYTDVRKKVGSHFNIRQRAKKQIQSFYKGATKNGVLTFVSPSGTHAGVYWTQKVQLMDLPSLIKQYKDQKTPRYIVNRAIQGNIKLYCNDPSFLYWGFKYIAWNKKYGIYKEGRFPKIRNPKLKGSVCKHLSNALEALPFNEVVITRDLKKKGAFS